jgi:hypothetical protein
LSGDIFNVKKFGAKGDAVTDDIAGFETAIAAMSTVQDLKGGLLYVPPGTYRLSRTLNITRPLRLLGASARYLESSVLLFDEGVTGVVTWHGAMGSPDGGHADGCSIEYLTIRAAGHAIARQPCSSKTAPPAVRSRLRQTRSRTGASS